MTRTSILIASLVASLGCNAIFGVDDGVARPLGAGGKAAAASTASSSASSSTASEGSGGQGGCNPYAGALNVTMTAPSNSNLVATYATAQDDVSGSYDGLAATVTGTVELPTTCFSISVVLSDKPTSPYVTFNLDTLNPPSYLDGFVQIDESDGPCSEAPMSREWESTAGTATMVTKGPGVVLITLVDVTMTALTDPNHTGTGSFTVNGTIQANCFGAP